MTDKDQLDLTDLEDVLPEAEAESPPSENLEPARPPTTAKDLEAVYDIPVQVSAVLGKSTMQVSQLLKLGRGAVVELDRKVGEAIDIYVNNRLVARGEVVVVDERLGEAERAVDGGVHRPELVLERVAARATHLRPRRRRDVAQHHRLEAVQERLELAVADRPAS